MSFRCFIFVSVEAEQTYMVIVFVVDERFNLAHQVFSLTGCEYFKANTVRQSDFLLQYIEPAVDNDKSELAVQ